MRQRYGLWLLGSLPNDHKPYLCRFAGLVSSCSAERRAEIERSLDRHPDRLDRYLRAIRTVDAVAEYSNAVASSPVVTPQVARSIEAGRVFVQQVEAEFGLLTAEEVGRLLGSRAVKPADLARKRYEAGGLVVLPRGSQRLYPGFQFDGATVRPVIAPLIPLGREYDIDPVGVAAWMFRRTTFLDGDRPVDHIDEIERLLDVARRQWGVEW